MKIARFAPRLLALIAGISCVLSLQADPAPPVTVLVDTNTVVHTMRGGIGASWHAIQEPIPIGHGGSGWGAYPPAEDERAWQQIGRHAAWLGLDWNRVEVEQRIYEPKRGQFTFDSPEMRILYRILDWNQQHGTDVFFQQMWVNTSWLAYTGAENDPIERVHSAPRDLDAFADGLATLMDHLIRARGYTCIKWLSITNEPGANWSWWQGPGRKPLRIDAGLAAVRKALAKRGLHLPLSGPDAGIEMFHAALTPDDGLLLDAYDFHDYGIRFDQDSGGYIHKQVGELSTWAKFAHTQQKPLFVAEYGTLYWPIVQNDPRPNNPESVLAAAEYILRNANAGVDAFNRWSFLNRGDLDGQWQFVDTWDPKQKKLLAEFVPHPNSYFGLGLLSRFTALHSSVLASAVSSARQQGWRRVYCAAFRSPKGNITLAIVNDATEPYALALSWAGTPPHDRFFRYRYARPQYDHADVKLDPDPAFAPAAGAGWSDTLPARSLTIYSTYKLMNSDPGIITDRAVRY